MVTGCLKYLLAAAGVGFLYVRRDLIERFEPTVTGLVRARQPVCVPDRRRSTGRRPRAGSRAGRRRCRTPMRRSAALDLLDRIGYDVVGRQVERLVGALPLGGRGSRLRRANPGRAGTARTARRGREPRRAGAGVTPGRARHRRVVPRQRPARLVSRLQQRRGRGRGGLRARGGIGAARVTKPVRMALALLLRYRLRRTPAGYPPIARTRM